MIKKESHLQLRTAIKKFVSLPDDEWDIFASELREKRLSRNAFLFRNDERVDKIYFVCKGLLRVFYSNENGAEINRDFIAENRFITCGLSFYRLTPCNYDVRALEDTHLLCFSRGTIEKLYERHKCWERLGRLVAEQNYIEKELKEARFRQLTPEEHYLKIIAEKPVLVKRIPLYHLASYLGITPETLSRIRRRALKTL